MLVSALLSSLSDSTHNQYDLEIVCCWLRLIAAICICLQGVAGAVAAAGGNLASLGIDLPSHR